MPTAICTVCQHLESSRIWHPCLTQAPGLAYRPSRWGGAFKSKKTKIDRCAVDFRLLTLESGVQGGLREYAPQLGYFCYPGDGEHVGAGAHVYVAVGGGLVNVLEGALHDALQLLVDFVLGPVVALDVLRPLEVGHGHASGVRQDVGEDHDALLEQDMVGLGGGW